MLSLWQGCYEERDEGNCLENVRYDLGLCYLSTG